MRSAPDETESLVALFGLERAAELQALEVHQVEFKHVCGPRSLRRASQDSAPEKQRHSSRTKAEGRLTASTPGWTLSIEYFLRHSCASGVGPPPPGGFSSFSSMYSPASVDRRERRISTLLGTRPTEEDDAKGPRGLTSEIVRHVNVEAGPLGKQVGHDLWVRQSEAKDVGAAVQHDAVSNWRMDFSSAKSTHRTMAFESFAASPPSAR